MSTTQNEHVTLPDWLRDSLGAANLMHGPLIRRTLPRRRWSDFFTLRTPGDARGEATFVRGKNISSDGIGCIRWRPLPIGKVFELSPVEGMGESVNVRVVHCTRADQGHAIGLEFVHGYME